jgi:hypothetical protein
MDDAELLDERDFVDAPAELAPVVVGPVTVPFLDPSWFSAVALLGAVWMGPWWPPSPFILGSVALFFVLGPLVPRFCEAGPAGLAVRGHSFVRFTVTRVAWDRLARYYWRQDARGWHLVLKVCRHRPGVVDNTFTWQFPQMTADEQHYLNAVLQVHCGPAQPS